MSQYQKNITHSITASQIFQTSSSDAATDVNPYICTNIPQVGGYFFDFNSLPISDSNQIAKQIDLTFYHYMADNAVELEFTASVVVFNESDITSVYYSDIYTSEAITSCQVNGNEKTLKTVTLGVSGSPICDLFSQYEDLTKGILVGIRVKDDTKTRYCYINGQIMDGNDTAWESPALPTDSLFVPTLTITSYVLEDLLYDLDVRYTTPNQASTQNLPNNSLGGYMSINSVYDYTTLNKYLSTTDTTAQVGTEPESQTGLVQIGAEIMSYGSVDSNVLTDLVRGLSPSTFSASPSLKNTPDKVIYLPIDNLFNTVPKNLTQYRCVAIMNSAASTMNDVEVYLSYNTLNKTVIDAAIELPDFCTRWFPWYGTDGSYSVIQTNDVYIITKPSGFYDNAYIQVEGTSTFAVINAFVVADGIATFTLDRSIDIIDTSTVIIFAAPSQIISNDYTEPSEITNFGGFFNNNGYHDINFTGTRETNTELRQYDLFYLWVKRELTHNTDSEDDSGNIIIIKYS